MNSRTQGYLMMIPIVIITIGIIVTNPEILIPVISGVLFVAISGITIIGASKIIYK